MRKRAWFTNSVLVKFYLGPVEVRLELERKATYLGLWWVTKRRKLHLYIAFMVMVQLHLVLPKRAPVQVSEAD